jgi:hypothetical protein
VPQVVIDNLILKSPFDEPTRHFQFGDEGITNEIVVLEHLGGGSVGPRAAWRSLVVRCAAAVGAGEAAATEARPGPLMRQRWRARVERVGSDGRT